MPTKKTIDGLNFSCLGYEVDCEGSVTTIWCKICREFYEEMKNETRLFLIKTAPSGTPKFSIMSLEEVEDANTEGLKVALKKFLEKFSLTKERKRQEIGMCTDGTPVNVRMHGLVKDELSNNHE